MEDPRSKAPDWTSRNSLLCNRILRLCGETSCDKVVSADLCSHAGILTVARCFIGIAVFVHPDFVSRFYNRCQQTVREKILQVAQPGGCIVGNRFF